MRVVFLMSEVHLSLTRKKMYLSRTLQLTYAWGLLVFSGEGHFLMSDMNSTARQVIHPIRSNE